MLTALPFDSLLDLLLDLLRSCAVRLPLHLLICRYDFLFLRLYAIAGLRMADSISNRHAWCLRSLFEGVCSRYDEPIG